MVRLYDEREKDFEILGLEAVKKYLGENYKECDDAFDIDEKLREENDGMIGYRCEEVEDKIEYDEYSTLKRKFRYRNKNYNTTFGVNVLFWSDGRICVCDKSGNERDITMDELKYLLSKYDELDRLVEKITAETNIEY